MSASFGAGVVVVHHTGTPRMCDDVVTSDILNRTLNCGQMCSHCPEVTVFVSRQGTRVMFVIKSKFVSYTDLQKAVSDVIKDYSKSIRIARYLSVSDPEK